MVCDLVTPGPQQGILLFAVDSCYQPVYGTDAAYFDNCAMVGSFTPVTADTRAEFLKACPNGDIRAYVPARTVTTTGDLVLNFAWLPVEFLATNGVVEPITFGGETVGYTDCDQAINLGVIVYQEALGEDACAGGEPGAASIITAYALRDVRISSDGEVGTSAFNYTVIGKTVATNIGSGPIPLFYDSGDPTEAAWPESCIPVCAKGAVFKAFGPPEECGVIDTVEPDDACVTAS
jgi:hypothetical protein